MSQLLTREAIEQAGTLITKKGNTVVPAASTLGVASGTNGCLITFDQSNSQISIGDNSNNAFLQLFTTSGDTAIRDSANANLLGFTADTSPVNYANIKNAATGNGPELACLGTDTNISLEVIPKGSGTLHLKGASAPSNGVDFSAGSTGTNSYILKGPQTGAQSAGTASIELPTFTSAPTTGHVLKVAASTSGTAVVTEWAADSSGGLTYNDVSSGTSQTAIAGNLYALTDNTRSSTFTVTLPSSPIDGQEIQVVDAAGLAGSQTITLTAGTTNINGAATGFDLTASYANAKCLAVTVNSTVQWVVI